MPQWRGVTLFPSQEERGADDPGSKLGESWSRAAPRESPPAPRAVEGVPVLLESPSPGSCWNAADHTRPRSPLRGRVDRGPPSPVGKRKHREKRAPSSPTSPAPRERRQIKSWVHGRRGHCWVEGAQAPSPPYPLGAQGSAHTTPTPTRAPHCPGRAARAAPRSPGAQPRRVQAVSRSRTGERDSSSRSGRCAGR